MKGQALSAGRAGSRAGESARSEPRDGRAITGEARVPARSGSDGSDVRLVGPHALPGEVLIEGRPARNSRLDRGVAFGRAGVLRMRETRPNTAMTEVTGCRPLQRPRKPDEHLESNGFTDPGEGRDPAAPPRALLVVPTTGIRATASPPCRGPNATFYGFRRIVRVDIRPRRSDVAGEIVERSGRPGAGSTDQWGLDAGRGRAAHSPAADVPVVQLSITR